MFGFTFLCAILPLFAFLLGQANARRIRRENSNESHSTSSKDKLDSESSETQSSKLSSKQSLNSPVLSELSVERQEDLEFYTCVIAKRAHTKVLMGTMIKHGFEIESEFIGNLSRLRLHISSQTHDMLERYFAEDSKRRIKIKEYPKLVEESKKCKMQFKNHTPILNTSLSIFNSVERDVLFLIGDTLFQGWRDNIKGFIKSINSALKKYTLDKLRKTIYDALWQVDPDLIASFHCTPPEPHRYYKKGSLAILSSKKKKASVLKHAEFSIAPIIYTRKGELRDSLLSLKIVLRGRKESEAIDLADAEVTLDPKNKELFTVKGKCVYSNHNHCYTLMAESELSRSHWVKSLRRFKRSKENASMNLAVIINSFLQFSRALENKNWREMEFIGEHCAKMISYDFGFPDLRTSIPVCLRAALMKAVGTDSWDDQSFKVCLGWMSTIVKGTLEMLKEDPQYNAHMETLEKEGKRGSHGKCVIS